jgi:hypothetical protein
MHPTLDPHENPGQQISDDGTPLNPSLYGEVLESLQSGRRARWPKQSLSTVISADAITCSIA